MQPKISSSPPLIIAHRGGADLWAENTLAAFENALNFTPHLDGIEIDVQCTKDGQVVIHHDLQLNPATTRLGGIYIKPPTPAIATLPYATLRQFDVGRVDLTSAYGKIRASQIPADGAHIPLLRELCALIVTKTDALRRANFHLIVELKTALGQDRADGARLVDAICTLLTDDDAVKECAAHMTFISFDWRCLAQLQNNLPSLNIGHLTPPFAITDPDAPLPPHSVGKRLRAASIAGAPWWHEYDWRKQEGDSHAAKVLQALRAAGGTKWFAHWQDLNTETLARAKAWRLMTAAWTVNDSAMMRTLRDGGIDALISDRPDLAAR